MNGLSQKLLALLVLASTIAFGLAGCAGDTSNGSKEQQEAWKKGPPKTPPAAYKGNALGTPAAPPAGAKTGSGAPGTPPPASKN
jgi:hypothetical protein